MRPDIILSNPPYGKVGVDITKHLMANHNDSQMAILGTKNMFNKHYRTVALEYVQVGEYQYDLKGGKTKRLDWGVKQAILLAWHCKGRTWTEVIPRGHVYGGHNVPIRVDLMYAVTGGSVGQNGIDLTCLLRNVDEYCISVSKSDCEQIVYNTYRTLPVYMGTAPGPIDFGGNTHIRTNLVCTVGLPKAEQELPQIEHVKWVNDMNPNYVWKAFDTLEEAISAAVYLGSWTTPSDSHNRLKKLGFIDTLIPHEE